MTKPCPFAASTKVAVDVGCGPGQATVQLADYFDNVIGIDGSVDQVSNAKKKGQRLVRQKCACMSCRHGTLCSILDNVEYRIGVAERLPVDNATADLVSVAQAIHWFELKVGVLMTSRLIAHLS